MTQRGPPRPSRAVPGDSYPGSSGQVSNIPARREEGHLVDRQQGPASQGEALSVAQTLSGLRGGLDGDSDEDEYSSQISTDSSPRETAECPPQPPSYAASTAGSNSRLDRDQNDVTISSRSSLDVRISLSGGHREDTAAPEAVHPPVAPWIAFLDEEVASTGRSGEHYAHRMLLALRAYFRDTVPTEGFASEIADYLHSVNEEYLVCISSWGRTGREEDLADFLWLVWGALLEVVVRMNYGGDDQWAVVMLVRELLRPRVSKAVRQTDLADGASWNCNTIPTFSSIWPSAHEGFRRCLIPHQPLEAAPEEWIALLSFLGRLRAAELTSRWVLALYPDIEMWALEDCLSETTWQDRPPSRKSECLVLAAAELVKHAGGRMAKAGAESDGWVRVYRLAKWRAWRRQFAQVARLFEGGPGPVQWAAWFAREHMFQVGEMAGFG